MNAMKILTSAERASGMAEAESSTSTRAAEKNCIVVLCVRGLEI